MSNLVLITGGAGFIGQRVARALLRQNVKCRVLDNFSPQIHATETLSDDLTGQVEVIKADVRDHAALKQALAGVDAIVHLAAETGTGQSMYEIERYFSVNVQGTATMLDLLQNDECGKSLRSIVVASSRAVYARALIVARSMAGSRQNNAAAKTCRQADSSLAVLRAVRCWRCCQPLRCRHLCRCRCMD